MVALAGEADHRRAGVARELDRERAHPARGACDDERVTGARRDRTHGCVGRCPRDEQSAGRVPLHAWWATRGVVGLHDDELGLAGAIVGEADHLVADREAADVSAELFDDSCQIAPLS